MAASGVMRVVAMKWVSVHSRGQNLYPAMLCGFCGHREWGDVATSGCVLLKFVTATKCCNQRKMNSGGIKFPAALIQYKAVTFLPCSPLVADLICLTPLVPGSTTLLKPVSPQFQMFVTSKLPPVKVCWNFWKEPFTAAKLNPLM